MTSRRASSSSPAQQTRKLALRLTASSCVTKTHSGHPYSAGSPRVAPKPGPAAYASEISRSGVCDARAAGPPAAPRTSASCRRGWYGLSARGRLINVAALPSRVRSVDDSRSPAPCPGPPTGCATYLGNLCAAVEQSGS